MLSLPAAWLSFCWPVFFVFLSTIDVNQYKDVIEEQAAAATGRTLTIEGYMDLSVRFSPAIVINGIRFQNADWGSRPDMAVIERVEASVPLSPFIFGNIYVTRLALVSPDVLLERNAQGQANWEFETGEAATESEEDLSALAISTIEIDNAKLAFKDAQGDTDVDAALDRLRVAISGALTAPDVERLALNGLSATIAGSDGAAPTEISISTLDLEESGGGTDVSLDSAVSGLSIGAEGSVGTFSSLATMSGTFPVDLALNLDAFEFNTDLDIDLDGDRPKVSGSVTADVIDLSTLPPAYDTPVPEKLFPADPLPMDALTAVDANVSVSVNRIVLKEDLAITDATTTLKLEKGTFTQSQSAQFAGGTLSSDVSLTAPAGTLSITAKVDGISAETIAKDLKATDIITQGDVGLEIALQGRGQSIAAMMASLDGSIMGGMGEARIRNEAINLAGADFVSQLISNLNPFATQEEFTVAECTVVNFQVNNGIARTEKAIAFVTDRMEITSSGQINLVDEKLDLNLRPKAREGLGVGMGKLTQAVKITGPLSKPGIGVDVAGAARTLGSNAGAFATGGASLLAEGALERGAATGDSCQAARTWHLAGK